MHWHYEHTSILTNSKMVKGKFLNTLQREMHMTSLTWKMEITVNVYSHLCIQTKVIQTSWISSTGFIPKIIVYSKLETHSMNLYENQAINV